MRVFGSRGLLSIDERTPDSPTSRSSRGSRGDASSILWEIVKASVPETDSKTMIEDGTTCEPRARSHVATTDHSPRSGCSRRARTVQPSFESIVFLNTLQKRASTRAGGGCGPRVHRASISISGRIARHSDTTPAQRSAGPEVTWDFADENFMSHHQSQGNPSESKTRTTPMLSSQVSV